MSNKDQISKEEKRAIVNYLSGKLSAGDTEIINHWLEKSDKNKLLFDQFSDIWLASSSNQLSNQIDEEKAWNEIQNKLQGQPFKTKKITLKEIVRIAAVFVIAFFLGSLGYYFLDREKPVETETRFVEYFSPLGSRSFVQLADGSKVWLNAGSTLKYNNTFGQNNRELHLSGEAFFDVEKNKKIPFVVKTSEIDVIAIGTQFNVKAYPEEKTIETTLIEGSVKLESSTVKLADNLYLKPNEKAVFTRKKQQSKVIVEENIEKEAVLKPKLEIIESVEPEPVISWKDQRWVIRNEKLGNLAVKLERRFDVNFIFDNEVLKEYSFRGTLEDESLQQIMEAIKFSSPIKYVIDQKTVYIMADGKKMEKFKNLMIK